MKAFLSVLPFKLLLPERYYKEAQGIREDHATSEKPGALMIFTLQRGHPKSSAEGAKKPREDNHSVHVPPCLLIARAFGLGGEYATRH